MTHTHRSVIFVATAISFTLLAASTHSQSEGKSKSAPSSKVHDDVAGHPRIATTDGPIQKNEKTWVDVPGCSLNITSTGYPIVVLAQLSGVQVYFKPPLIQKVWIGDIGGRVSLSHFYVPATVWEQGGAARFRMLIDNVPRCQSEHHFNNGLGMEMRDVSMHWMEKLSMGEHTVNVQSVLMQGERLLISEANPKVGDGNTRSLIAFEVPHASIRTDVLKAITEVGIKPLGEQQFQAMKAIVRQELEQAFRQELRDQVKKDIMIELKNDKKFREEMMKELAVGPKKQQ